MKGQTEVKQVKMISMDSPVYFLIQENYKNDAINTCLDLIVIFIKDYSGMEKYDELSNSHNSSNISQSFNQTDDDVS
jgi:hypothetical protein